MQQSASFKIYKSIINNLNIYNFKPYTEKVIYSDFQQLRLRFLQLDELDELIIIRNNRNFTHE